MDFLQHVVVTATLVSCNPKLEQDFQRYLRNSYNNGKLGASFYLRSMGIKKAWIKQGRLILQADGTKCIPVPKLLSAWLDHLNDWKSKQRYHNFCLQVMDNMTEVEIGTLYSPMMKRVYEVIADSVCNYLMEINPGSHQLLLPESPLFASKRSEPLGTQQDPPHEPPQEQSLSKPGRKRKTAKRTRGKPGE